MKAIQDLIQLPKASSSSAASTPSCLVSPLPRRGVGGKVYIILLTLLLTGCQRLVLGEEPANDPLTNFDLFWNDFDAHYGLFTVRGWDWDSIRTEYQPRINPETTDEELFSYFSEMIGYLDDSHTFVYWPGQNFFASGSEGDAPSDLEFSYDNIYAQVEVIDTSRENGLFYGRVRGRPVGYLYLAGFDLEEENIVDRIVADLSDTEAMIIDLRHNTGGDDLAGKAIAGRFADREELVYTVQERNGPDHGDFAEQTEYYSAILGEQQYRKPVVVLTDTVTVSAAEVFLLYLKSFDDVTQIGTGTSGDFSDTGMRRFLPNGMQYQYSIMKFLTPEGHSLDGVGHQPDIHSRNTPEDIIAGRDIVLDRTYQFLFEEYGIE